MPSPLTPLVGRERETADIRRRLAHPGTRLMSLIGPGGVGKTRLALHIAVDSADYFKHGVCFVDLAPISDPDLVVSAVAQALGVPEGGGRPVLESLGEYLRNKQLLLLLDNFDQVLDAGPAVAALLAACPELKVLVTSRAVLHLYGEHDFAVPPLSLPGASLPRPADALAGSEAVRLFVDRAQAARSDFQLTDANTPAVAEICRRLDGLPLAIELAAARVRLFAPSAILGNLERRLSFLTGGARDMPARQRTLRATLDWSYDLLSADEQLLFRRLSVFAGGCTLDAVDAVYSASGERGIDVLSGIFGLEEKSLLGIQEPLGQLAPVAQDRPRPVHGGTPPPTSVAPRVGMLATVREYALEKLEASGEAEEIHRRHAEHVLALVEGADPKLRGAEQLAWLERLQADNDNLRAALRWSIERGHADLAGRLVVASWWFWYLRSHLSEGRDWLQQALDLPGASACSAARATALMAVGVLARHQSDFASSCRWLERSVALWRELDDPRGLAYALSHLGFARWSLGERAEGAALQTAALAMFREVGDAWALGMPLTFLARMALERGDFAQARSALLARADATIWPSNRADYDRDLATARGQVDEATFDAAWAEGRAMTTEQSIAYALETADHGVQATIPPTPTADVQPPPPLSRRELEVAVLVAPSWRSPCWWRGDSPTGRSARSW